MQDQARDQKKRTQQKAQELRAIIEKKQGEKNTNNVMVQREGRVWCAVCSMCTLILMILSVRVMLMD